uniref:Adhesion G protein-coupled receptor F3b n=1 Tax=Sphaeramia orbicularis TaxID=375764 RepID=A0A673BPK4_9TELE
MDGWMDGFKTVFNVSVFLTGSNLSQVKTAGFKNLQRYLPYNNGSEPNSIVVSTTTQSKQHSDVEIKINFKLLNPRPPNVELQCVWWDTSNAQWSPTGCKWEGPFNEGQCVCTHLSSFAILMSKVPVKLPGLTEITYVGLSVSVVSLIISLLIELIVWSHVVKTSGLYLRHTAQINICLCLLIADVCFLASSEPKTISSIWCQTFVVLKHFFYLSMFFWMLCLSSTLLHRTVFPFHEVSKKNYLRFSIILGYVCPLLIVFITFLTNKGGKAGHYFSRDTCWLIYSGTLKGSLHTFLIPVGIIVFVSVFSMLVVIMKLLGQTNNADKCNQIDKNAAKTVVRTVVLLTPIFGVTWIFGFGVTYLDLTHGDMASVVNYAFTLLNSFQFRSIQTFSQSIEQFHSIILMYIFSV